MGGRCERSQGLDFYAFADKRRTKISTCVYMPASTIHPSRFYACLLFAAPNQFSSIFLRSCLFYSIFCASCYFVHAVFVKIQAPVCAPPLQVGHGSCVGATFSAAFRCPTLPPRVCKSRTTHARVCLADISFEFIRICIIPRISCTSPFQPHVYFLYKLDH